MTKTALSFGVFDILMTCGGADASGNTQGVSGLTIDLLGGRKTSGHSVVNKMEVKI